MSRRRYENIKGPERIKLKCKTCGKLSTITTNDKAVYTEEVRKDWDCIFCSTRGRKK